MLVIYPSTNPNSAENESKLQPELDRGTSFFKKNESDCRKMKDSNSFLKKTSLSLLSSRSERQLAKALRRG